MSVDSVSPWQQVRALQTALFNGVQPQKLLAEALQLLVEQMHPALFRREVVGGRE